MKHLLITFLPLLSLPVIAQQEIKIEDAVDHVGDSVKICSTVYGGRFLGAVKGSPTFLNLGSSYQNVPVTIIIGDVRNKFKGSPRGSV